MPKVPENLSLLLYFVFWYAGNAKYNEVGLLCVAH
jgi:hypothetical protein